MNLLTHRRFVAALFLVLIPWSGQAQQSHMMHDGVGHAHGDEVIQGTMPANDAVLENAPEQLMLHFDSDVRLVKLTLHDADRDAIDINFRYDPQPDDEFMWPLPELMASDYYSVDWAIVNAEDRVIRGSFHFAFGPDAQPPSEVMESMEPMRHIMTPDYRLLE